MNLNGFQVLIFYYGVLIEKNFDFNQLNMKITNENIITIEAIMRFLYRVIKLILSI